MPRHRRGLIVLAVAGMGLGVGVSAFAQRATRTASRVDSAMPGPARGPGGSDRVELNAGCVECHPAAAEQWTGSLHQRSYVDADVAEALHREDRAFCRSCHAPESDPSHEPSAPLAALGVACVTCHVPAGADLPAGGVLAAPSEGPFDPAPHPVRRESAFGDARACGGCHQFASPQSRSFMMQATLDEHRGSAFAEASCQDCHMPVRSDGHRGHRFPASRDPQMLRSSVQAQAVWRGDSVFIQLRTHLVGHAVPTGDLFRRLVVELGTMGSDGWTTIDDVRLTRQFERHGRGRVEVADTRLPPDGSPTVVQLDARGHATERLWWRVAYERIDMDGPFDEDPRVFDRIIVAEGHVLPSTP